MSTYYKVDFDIHTDGDFNYANRDVELVLVQEFLLAVKHVEFRLQEIIDSIHGKDFVVEDVKRELNRILENVEVYIDWSSGSFYAEFDCGNQSGEIEIVMVEESVVDGVKVYKRLSA